MFPIIKISDSTDSGGAVVMFDDSKPDGFCFFVNPELIATSSTFSGILSVMRVMYCSFFESNTVRRNVGSWFCFCSGTMFCEKISCEGLPGSPRCRSSLVGS